MVEPTEGNEARKPDAPHLPRLPGQTQDMGASLRRMTIQVRQGGLGVVVDQVLIEKIRPRLVFGLGAGQEIIELDGGVWCIGRDPDPTEGSSLVLADEQISWHHATLTFWQGKFEIEDQGSKNGTWLNGVRLEPGKPLELTPESLLRFGSIESLFVVNADRTGAEINPQGYKDAVALLQLERKISARQLEAAEEGARGSEHHIGEVLVAAGVILPSDWREAVNRGTGAAVARDAIQKVASWRRVSLALASLVLALLALIAIRAPQLLGWG